MKTTPIICLNCHCLADKPQKEITRQQKKGNYNYFCSKLCYRNWQIKNHSNRWEAVHNRARYNFIKNNSGPYTCYFCHKKIHTRFDVHHIDNNHENGANNNLTPAHPMCHNAHHKENYKTRKIHAVSSSQVKYILGIV